MNAIRLTALIALAGCLGVHAESDAPTPQSFLEAFTPSTLQEALGVSIDSEIDTASADDRSTKGNINIYVVRVNHDIKWSRIPYLTIKIAAAGTLYKLPFKDYLKYYETDKVGACSYGVNYSSKGDTIAGSDLVFTSTNKKWDVSISCNIREKKLPEITALAARIDKWLVNGNKTDESMGGAASASPEELRAPVTDGDGTQNSSQLHKSESQLAIKEWDLYLIELQKTKLTFSEKEFSASLDGKFREKGMHVWGGTGNYSMYYLIDDVVQIRADFTVENKLSGHPIAQPKGVWIRRPDGTLRLPPEQVEIPLTEGTGRKEAKGLITLEQSKVLIRDFLKTSPLAKGSQWILASQDIIDKQEMSEQKETGCFVWGPWTVDPKSRKVRLFSDAASLEGDIQKDAEGYSIANAKVLRIRGEIRKKTDAKDESDGVEKDKKEQEK